MTVYQAPGEVPTNAALPQPNNLESFTMGDIRLYPKWAITHDPDGFGLALLGVITLPTGSPENLQGNESVTVEPRLVAQLGLGDNFRFALSGGFLIREEQELFNITVGNEVTFGAGVEYKFEPGKFAVIAEGYGKVSVDNNSASENNPIEVALAGRYWPDDPHALTLGVARGLTDGYGSPNFRVFAGYNYTPKGDRDPDGDGLVGDDDQCPFEPEDFDEFQDEDGCADPDNDNDGIRDIADKCPLESEDYDGYEDADGCPDPDNDGDGILDVDDGPNGSCKNDAEDLDGFEDTDGCPDPDNDRDNVLDKMDGPPGADGWGTCMNDPEDLDGFEDENGCPDPDNDGDGILDVDDQCPDDPTDACRARVVGRCEIEILDKVFFSYDKDIIKKKSFAILNEVAAIMQQHTWIKLIEVAGHTDSDGTATYNIDLSQRRTASVKKYLMEQGIDASRLEPKGYGEAKPVGSNATPAKRAKNRRVQFIILNPSQEDCKK
jgi:outer membrane protein OmpA-like peptidoglycan-associated protein